ncbi:MAG: cellulase family glycosylhydrolase [Candidatus Coatesbacteria bacterium]
MRGLTVMLLAAWAAGGGMSRRAEAAAPRGYVHASGTELVDGAGSPLRLRGVNLGFWLLWESYLIRFEGKDLTESRMKRAVVDLVGREAAGRFFRSCRENTVAPADLRRIRELGWNCVRIPFNARILSDRGHFDLAPGEGWRVLDRALDWCEAEGLYVVLDMHSAPGGQNAGGISDNDNHAGLFEGPSTTRFRDETAALWGAIARRYAKRTIIAAYDLLNEPVVKNEWGDGEALMAVTRRLVAAVRREDPDHMIMVEGNWYATDFHMFEGAALDSNLCYQFHKYWSETGPDTIGYLVDLRRKLDAPFWLGETGENSRKWYARCIGLMEEAGFGWCFWPWKRIGDGCIQRVDQPDAWRRTSEALGDPGKRKGLSRKEAVAGLTALAEALRLANCREDPETVRALRGEYPEVFRVPGRLDAAEYARCAVRQKGNAGGRHRAGDADIFKEGEALVVRNLEAGDSLAWDVEALAADVMRPVLHGATGFLDVLVDGATLPPGGAGIAAGRHVVTVRATAARAVAASAETAGAAPAALAALELASRPGRIEAEDFLPGQDAGYHDLDNVNHGKSEVRKGEGVSVEECSEGGCNIGWIEAGEWFTWRIEVPRAGTYDLVIRYSSRSGGGPFRLSLEGRKLADGLMTPSTGWWQNWADLKVPGLALPAGSHLLRLDAVKGGYNLNYFLFLPH